MLFKDLSSWLNSVQYNLLPLLGAWVIVIALEVILQGKDNSLTVLRGAKGKSFDIFSVLMSTLRIHQIVLDLILLGSLIKFKNWANIHSLGFYWNHTFLGTVSTMVISLIVYDFLLYWNHRLKHMHDGLWIIHRFHHSTTDLNAFSSERAHTLDYFFRALTISIPMLFIAGPSFENLAWLWFFDAVIGVISHSRLNVDYKFLGKIIIGPRFHRRHHSLHDHDCNYSLFFSYLDKAFGTYKDESDAFERPTGTKQQSDAGNVFKAYLGEYQNLVQWCFRKKTSNKT